MRCALLAAALAVAARPPAAAGWPLLPRDSASPPLSLARRAAAHWHAGLREHDAGAGAREAAAGAASRRPIITGCLKECGYEEQTCVTQCQVCVEHNECRILGKCDSCLREAHQYRILSAKTDNGVLDAGGVSMMRDGMMAEMKRAHLEALDRKRRLRVAREEVLKAQRQAEWAAEERHMAAKDLLEARQVLKGARLEVARWKLRNEKKLKAMRAKAREQRLERQRAERKLAARKRQAKKARRRLRIATDASAANATDNPGNTSKDEEEVWEIARDVEERQQAVERAERDVDKASADSEWLDRGLNRRVKRELSAARKAREELLESRAQERVSRERLDEAKDQYVEAVAASQRADKAAELAEQNLRKAPSSPYPEPPGMKLEEEDTPAHSAAASLAGGAWPPLLALLAGGLAARPA